MLIISVATDVLNYRCCCDTVSLGPAQVQEWDRMETERESASPAQSASRSRTMSMAEIELEGEVAKVLEDLAEDQNA
eukprot:scaffold238252_cov50-Prasinocladus_malaysianus.AAC.1